MKTSEILNITKHRPGALPKGKWKFYQEWNSVVFLHWEVDLNVLRALVPKELEIDLFEGKPWVSLVAFTMEKIRPRYLPSFSPISNFDEINIRTYVKRDKKQGIYFLSIEAGNFISCMISRAISELPYRYSKINRQDTVYTSSNKPFDDKLKMVYKVGKPVHEKTQLDIWLTEKYTLFQDTETNINEFELHHVEWPIHKIDIVELKIENQRFNKLLNNLPDRMHYSSGVQVVAWDKKKTKRT